MSENRDKLTQPPEEYREERPWGDFRRLVHNEPCTVKLITVRPGQRLSLQSHSRRSELWVFLDEGGIAEVDGEQIKPGVGDRVFVPCGARHRLATSPDAAGSVRIVEMGFGDFDEDDIVRYEDQYGRA